MVSHDATSVTSAAARTVALRRTSFASTRRKDMEEAFNIKGFVPLYIRPLFCEGSGPFRWVALSGDPKDIYTTDKILKNKPQIKKYINWILSPEGQKIVDKVGYYPIVK